MRCRSHVKVSTRRNTRRPLGTSIHRTPDTLGNELPAALRPSSVQCAAHFAVLAPCPSERLIKLIASGRIRRSASFCWSWYQSPRPDSVISHQPFRLDTAFSAT